MDDLLARERAAHEYVKSLQSHAEMPFEVTLNALDTYRTTVREVAIANIAEAEKHETRLWEQHVEIRQLLARTLRDLRKRQEQKPVETRAATQMYLRFLKHSIRFYRDYIYQLSVRYGGIPELEAVAQQIKQDKEVVELKQPLQMEQCEGVLRSCHRTLIYLGDLCRYRATDRLDKHQDFGPAIGFYGLACTIRPESGWGHNQQAVVALENKDHPRATFHLYRAILVPEPVVLAKKSIMLHFERSNSAWEKGELIKKTGGPDANMQTILGLFVRLHSMCANGERHRGYDELEQGLLTRLQNELRSRSLDNSLVRMVFVNLGAQHFAMDKYRDTQNAQTEQAFYYFMRINVVFFTALLELFRMELFSVAANFSLATSDLDAKLTPIMLRILPAIRLYSAWLLLNSHLALGLASNEFIGSAIAKFWSVYAQTLDLIASVFPIWDLEDVEPVQYMLEEDTEALCYLPLDDEQAPVLVRKLFYHNSGATLKPRFSDAIITRLNDAEESLARILHILEFGSFIANDVDDSPVFIRSTRFVLGIDSATFDIPMPPKPEPQKPLSYAAAAKTTSQSAASSKSSPTFGANPGSRGMSNNSQDDARLSRMVDSLIEDDDTDHPLTPPQPWASNPAVVPGNGELFDVPTLAPSPKIESGVYRTKVSTAAPITKQTKPSRKARTKRNDDLSEFSPRPQRPGSAAQLWSPTSPRVLTPTSVLQRSAQSPVQSPGIYSSSVHQRVSSSNSMRSSTSQGQQASHSRNASRSKLDAAAKLYFPGPNAASPDRLQTPPRQNGNVHLGSPLLFGAGSIWSATPASRPDSDG